MAARGAAVRLDQRTLQDLANKSASEKFLSPVHFLLVEPSSGVSATLAVCHVVYVRPGGFMLAIPNSIDLQDALRALESTANAHAAFHAGQVEVLTQRGRSLGVGDIILVDLPWESAEDFVKPVKIGSGQFRDAELLQVTVNGSPGRPSKEQTQQLADAWIGGEDMDEDTAQEYLTGEDLGPDEPFGAAGGQGTGIAEGSDGGSAEKRALLARIAVLESQLQDRPTVPTTSPVPKPLTAASASKAPMLFGAQPAVLDDQQWGRLQRLAGAPPPRAGQVEQRRLAVGPATTYRDNALLGLEREAEEDQQLDALAPPLAASSQDPLHQILAAQLQQNQLLLQRMAPRHSDPVLGALAGSDNGSGSGGNVKGCLARETFQRTIQDLPRVANHARLNALRELGISPEKEDASLMRKYVERRIPLAEFKLLALVATMLAESWAVGYETGDMVLLGTVARMLFFVEQAAIDSGKTQLAWLLTGYSEPSLHMMVSSKKRPGLEPFARLCPPAWISANLSYLKDLDFMETRLQSLEKGPKNPKANAADDKENPQPKRPSPKPKGKGKGKSTPEAPAADAAAV